MLFICLFVPGCGIKVERPKEILVTDIMMPADGEFVPRRAGPRGSGAS